MTKANVTLNPAQEQPPLILVDGSSYLFRAFHALPDLATRDGFPTGAIRGVVSMFRRLLKDYPGSTVVAIFDAPGKTFRDDLYSEYKANRAAMPDDLRPQIEPIHAIMQAMGLPLVCIEGVEADDVIGTYAAQAKARQYATLISTGDKDMAQLVGDHVTLVNTMTETVLDHHAVVEKFGVPPELIIDYLALMGDTVDNIPGVPKVGPKTAAKWLNEFGSLDAVMANADAIKGKVGENLRASLDHLPLSRTLTTIKCDVDLPLDVEALKMQAPDTATLLEWFGKLEFKSWQDELNDGEPAASQTDSATAPAPETDYHTLFDVTELASWIDEARQAGTFAFDTETTSLDYMHAEIVGFSLAVAPGRAAYVPLGHDYPGAPDQLDAETALNLLAPLLQDPQLLKVGQNLKYDISVLARHGVSVVAPITDTMLQSYVLNSVATRHNMDALAGFYLDRKTIHFEDIAGKGAKQLTFNEVPLETAATYAAEDADITLQLHHVLSAKLQAEPILEKVLNEIEIPLVPILSAVERRGARVDGRLLTQHSAELSDRLKELTEQAWSVAGETFNLDSTKQLQTILYEKLGLPVLKKTPGGKPSTAEPVLAELASDYELPATLMTYRSLAKLKSTYTDKLPLQINSDTKCIHTSYHQAVTATGRLSSSDPNLQNIPIRTPEGRRIRQAFVSAQDRLYVAADYSQIELRIMAHLSADAGLNTAFAEDEDIHRATAAEVFGCAPDDVSDDQRRSAKAINFGLIYGMSAFGLAKQLNVSRTLAQDYIDRYFDRYPGVLSYMDATRALAHEQGYVETVFGRRLYLPEINSRQAMRRQAAERTAINAPMQGTAADIIKFAMISVQDWLQNVDLDAAMIMQVHDELVFDVAKADVDALCEGVETRMSGAANLSVPLLVATGIGSNWDEAH